jgi:hypothetical protein
MSINYYENENGLINKFENRLNKHLVHRASKRQRISPNEIENLAITKYQNCGLGITINDIIQKFQCKKTKAQKKMKLLCKESINKKGERKKPILFTLKRTKPQQYFPNCIRATIIENKKKRLIDSTGTDYSNKPSSHYPLHYAIENQIVQSFLIQLSLLPFQPLNIHNIHLLIRIDKSHYEEINQRPCFECNRPKIIRERIGLRDVVFQFYKNGSIVIEIACSKNLFPIGVSNDVLNFFEFLGEVRCTLAIILNDPRQRIVPPIDNWLLKSCDFNKDIEVDDKSIGQLMDLNIQVKHMGEAFRLYVKNLEDRFALRGEKVMKVNQPITSFMNDSILSPLHFIQTIANEFANNIAERILTDIDKRIEKLLIKDENFANSK